MCELQVNFMSYTLDENGELLNAVHSGKVLTTSNGNESGTLWECLWRWTEEAGYQSKSCSSGLFLDWHTYDSQTHFLNRLKEDIADFRFSGI